MTLDAALRRRVKNQQGGCIMADDKSKSGNTKNKSKNKECKNYQGRMIEPLDVMGNGNVKAFIDEVFGASGYNARRLGEACDIYTRMAESGATIALTLAGAMTPIGMSGPIIELMKRGLVDVIISTGANLYHDFHRAYNFPVIQGSPHVDDALLNKRGIARIYDTYIMDDDTLLPTDAMVLDASFEHKFKGPVSSASLHKLLGEKVLKDAPFPEKSLVAQAVRYGVPIYTSSPGDSSIAMNMILPYFMGKRIVVDPVMDIVETTAIVRQGKKNGVVIVGGGSPKNFYLQTQPTLWQILKDDIGGHDYFIQLTTDTPQWGGLSGATPQEAKSWGKVKGHTVNQTVVYSCASITFPLLSRYVMESVGEKPLKRLLDKRDSLAAELKRNALANPELKKLRGKKAPKNSKQKK